MEDKKKFRINKYNTAVFLVLLIIIYSIVSQAIRLKEYEKQFLNKYQNELQVKNELLADSVLFYLRGNSDEGNSWEAFLDILKREDSIDDSSWTYVAYDGNVVYYKNRDLIKNNNTVPLEEFVRQLQENSMITTQSSFFYNNGTFIIGLAAGENMLLRDWGYNSLYTVLLLEDIVVTLLLAFIGIDSIRKSMRKSREVVRLEKEVVSLNCKVEEINQELNQIIIEKESEGFSQLKHQTHQYDMELVSVLLMKANDISYLPVGIIYVQFDMGDLYFTKKRMNEIEEQLRVQLLHKYELFEIGKGEFVFIMVRTGVDEIMQSLVLVEEKANNIAKDNRIQVTVRSRTITSIKEEPLSELDKIRERI